MNYPLDPFTLIWCGVAILLLGVAVGAIIVGIAWGTHNNRMAEAATQRQRERDAARDEAETALIRAATQKLDD